MMYGHNFTAVAIFLVSMLYAPIIYAQDTIAATRHYDNTRPATTIDSAFYNIEKMIFVSLDNGFDDSLYITVNGFPVINKYLVTDHSIDQAAWFMIRFTDSTEVKYLKLKFVKANRCLEEKVDLSYKSLIISKRDSWKISYSNHFFMRE